MNISFNDRSRDLHKCIKIESLFELIWLNFIALSLPIHVHGAYKLLCTFVGVSSRTPKHLENTSNIRLRNSSYFLVICLRGIRSMLLLNLPIQLTWRACRFIQRGMKNVLPLHILMLLTQPACCGRFIIRGLKTVLLLYILIQLMWRACCGHFIRRGIKSVLDRGTCVTAPQ